MIKMIYVAVVGVTVRVVVNGWALINGKKSKKNLNPKQPLHSDAGDAGGV